MTGTASRKARPLAGFFMACKPVIMSRPLPAGKPECTPTAANRSGYSAPSTAAIAPPADMPATNTCAGSAPCSLTICRVSPAMMSGSPASRAWWPDSNQFQHCVRFDALSCSGYSTRQFASSARRFMPVPSAKSSGFWVQPCSMTINGRGAVAGCDGIYSL